MCRRGCLGCLSITAFLTIVSGLIFGLFWSTAGRIAGEPPQEPVSIAGDCPEQETVAYVAEGVVRLQATLAPLDEIEHAQERGLDFNEVFDANLLVELANARDATAAMAVPACAAALHDAELDLADMVSRAVAYSVRDDRPVFLRGAMTVAVLLRGMEPHLSRVTDGHDRLAQRFGYLDGDALRRAVLGKNPAAPATSPAP